MTVPFHFATCAWGGHVDLMLDVMLPSLLASGNLPALKGPGSLFSIYTSAEDYSRVVGSKVFAAALDVLPMACSVVDTAATIGPRGIYGPSTEAYITALRFAYECNAVLSVCTPDAVFSDGFVGRLQMHAENGVRCVHSTGLRLSLEKTREGLINSKESDGSLSMDPRALVFAALHTLHPCMSVHLWDGPGDFLPSNLIWPVEGGDGLVVHPFHSYPAMIRPTRIPDSFGTTLDDDFALGAVPDLAQHVCLTDSDHGCAFELSPADKRLAGQCARSIEGVRGWLPSSANRMHRWTAGHSFRLHAGDIERTVNAAPWIETEARAEAVMREILA